MDILTQIAANHARGEHYQNKTALPPDTRSPVRLIAFYLPQFHPIPENDLWWGKGFTEWTNVSKALPRFKGHYQPHLPGELGFYDLRLPQVLRQQAELVRDHGLAGLCFHHYWFDGKPLLDTPIRLLLENKDIDLPFCVNWANEHWSRRWDGNDQEILIGQAHSPADDIAFAASLEPLFRDPRYIRVNGRALLMLYRPRLLPDAAATVRRWREHFHAAGLGNPYVVMAQGFGDDDPRPYGLDAAAGFPPHRSGFDAPPMQDSLERLDPDFQGIVVRYADMAAAALANQPAEFRLFPGVCPSWDNEARKPARGFCALGATPAAYHDWLAAACEGALAFPDPDERIVFINAWNEWAEGAHLEPDRHFGYAYLNETAKVVAKLSGLGPTALRRGANTSAPTPRVRRKPRDLPGLIAKNLVFHAANAAEATARFLRGLR
jgi:lipopolysaccharide biosynthesis protein